MRARTWGYPTHRTGLRREGGSPVEGEDGTATVTSKNDLEMVLLFLTVPSTVRPFGSFLTYYSFDCFLVSLAVCHWFPTLYLLKSHCEFSINLCYPMVVSTLGDWKSEIQAYNNALVRYIFKF